MMIDEPLLGVQHLGVRFGTKSEQPPAVNDLSFTIGAGEQIAILGRSGSGKSTVARALLGLLPKTALVVGQLQFNGVALPLQGQPRWQAIRGGQIALVAQESQSALNPVRTVGSQFVEVIKRHQSGTKSSASDTMTDWLRQLDLPPAVVDHYPHQLSGGMRQRVLLAMALSCRPKLLIADECTSGLDHSNQLRVLESISELCAKQNTGLLLISHDLGLVHRYCSRALVMVAGHLVEAASPSQLFSNPSHHGTAELVAAAQQLEALL